MIFFLSALDRGSSDPIPAPDVPRPVEQDEGEVRESVRRFRTSLGLVPEGRRRSQLVSGRGGEAEDQLDHQVPAVRRLQERVRQPVAENQRNTG